MVVAVSLAVAIAKSFTFQSEYNWMPFAYSIAMKTPADIRASNGFFCATFNSSRRYAMKSLELIFLSMSWFKKYTCAAPHTPTHQFDCKYLWNAHKRLHSYIEFCANVKMWNKVCKHWSMEKSAPFNSVFVSPYFTLFKMNFETFSFQRNSHCQSCSKGMAHSPTSKLRGTHNRFLFFSMQFFVLPF